MSDIGKPSTMTIKQADKLIGSGRPVIVRNVFYNEVFEIVIADRGRHNVYTVAGGVFDRSELEIVGGHNDST